MSEVRVWGLICPGRTEEIGRVRRWTRDILSDHPSADDAVVIVSELGTNALLYTASGQENGVFQVALALSDHVLAVSVTDAGDSATIPGSPPRTRRRCTAGASAWSAPSRTTSPSTTPAKATPSPPN
ncbi:ATP-binding protein [Streptomyces jumonjinensis]|uniref:ATP-binding protein n=1 Tax=Streptomyces jumonjinensis TaxID=1945 RepID=UPI00378C2A92